MTADALLSVIAGRDTEGYIEVRCRRPSDGRITARDWFELDERQACLRFIATRSSTLDVYVGVAPRIRREGGKAAIQHSWLLYVDCDSEAAVARLEAFSPAPSLVVRSGTGSNCHAYWSLTAPIPPAWFERANRRLAHHLGADVKVTDAARILRPPGSRNHKHDPPTLVTAEPSSSLSPVTLASLVKKLPDPPSFRPLRQPRINWTSAEGDDPLDAISADHYYQRLTGRDVTRGNVTCPFHAGGNERQPSMRLYDTTWYCFKCCEGGSVYEFGSLLWGLGRRGADFIRLRERLTDALG